MKQTVDFLNECEALSAALESLGGNELARLTQFKGWRIEDVIVHLYFWNLQADDSTYSCICRIFCWGRLVPTAQRWCGWITWDHDLT